MSDNIISAVLLYLSIIPVTLVWIFYIVFSTCGIVLLYPFSRAAHKSAFVRLKKFLKEENSKYDTIFFSCKLKDLELNSELHQIRGSIPTVLILESQEREIDPQTSVESKQFFVLDEAYVSSFPESKNSHNQATMVQPNRIISPNVDEEQMIKPDRGQSFDLEQMDIDSSMA